MTGVTDGASGEMAEVVRQMTVRNKYGIHARPAALFVKTAGKYACEIAVEKAGMVVSGKSIMGLLTLEGHEGAVLTVTATGPDAEAAVAALEQLVESKFNEE